MAMSNRLSSGMKKLNKLMRIVSIAICVCCISIQIFNAIFYLICGRLDYILTSIAYIFVPVHSSIEIRHAIDDCISSDKQIICSEFYIAYMFIQISVSMITVLFLLNNKALLHI